MIFEEGHIYHIFNQGNNRQPIFFCRENYLFFIQKMRTYLLPYGDILAWCLMPNHFHIMLYVKHSEFTNGETSQGFTSSEPLTDNDKQCDEKPIEGFTQSETFNNSGYQKTLNSSIGIMLRSYTRAINNQQHRTGALFREKTKAECVTACEGITPSFFGKYINTHFPEEQYPKICFDYIHNNPVMANLVKAPENWEYSSFSDIYGTRGGTLINKERIAEYIG